MQENISLLKRAKIDLKVANQIISNWDDEVEIDIAAYHTQQAIEKAMKYAIELTGTEPPKTHIIKDLWDLLDRLGQTPPEWIWSNHDQLTNFATKTRYGKSLVAAQREVKELISLVDNYLTAVEQSTQLSESDARFKASEYL